VEIQFATERLRDECNDSKTLVRLYGKQGAKRLRQRLDDLDAAANLEMMRSLPGKLHELTGDRKGRLAMTVDGGKRLILEPVDPEHARKPDGGLDWAQVTAVRMLGVEDYHR
jgi:proteic killer suppression protein